MRNYCKIKSWPSLIFQVPRTWDTLQKSEENKKTKTSFLPYCFVCCWQTRSNFLNRCPNNVSVFPLSVQLCLAVRDEIHCIRQDFWERVCWMGGNEGIKAGLERVPFWKGSTCGWWAPRPGKMFVWLHSKECKREREKLWWWDPPLLCLGLDQGSFTRHSDTTLLQQWIRNETEVIHKGWRLHHWHPRS